MLALVFVPALQAQPDGPYQNSAGGSLQLPFESAPSALGHDGAPGPEFASNILVVDDDNSDSGIPGYLNSTSAIAQALTDAGYTYDYYYVHSGDDGPALQELAAHRAVVWVCGYENGTASQTLTYADQDAIIQYLQMGRSLFLVGQDIMRDINMGSFARDWLGVSTYSHNGGKDYPVPNPLLGVIGDPATNGINATTIAASPRDNADALNFSGAASGCLQLAGGPAWAGYCGGRVSREYRAVFFALDLLTIPSLVERRNLVQKAMWWLDESQWRRFSVYPETSGYGLQGQKVRYFINLTNHQMQDDSFEAVSVTSAWSVDIRLYPSGMPLQDSNNNTVPDTGSVGVDGTLTMTADIQLPPSVPATPFGTAAITFSSFKDANFTETVNLTTLCYAPGSHYRAVYLPYAADSASLGNTTSKNDLTLLSNAAEYCAGHSQGINALLLRSRATMHRTETALFEWDAGQPEISLGVLGSGAVTYSRLVSSRADIILIANASDNSTQFSPAEIADISRYVREGHGIIATGGTVVSGAAAQNAALAPLFNLTASQSDQWCREFCRVVPGPGQHPLMQGLGEFTPAAVLRGVAAGLVPSQNASVPASAESLNGTFPIIAYDSLTSGADVRVEGLLAPSWIQAGQKATVKATIRNRGNATASNLWVNFTVNGTMSEQTMVASLAPGASFPISFDSFQPAEPGRHVLGVQVQSIPGEVARPWDKWLQSPCAVMNEPRELRAALLRSPAANQTAPLGLLQSKWHEYASPSAPFLLSVGALPAGEITWEALNMSLADVLIAPSAGKGFSYTDAEISAIESYLRGGRGIVATFSTLDGAANNMKLAPLFGLSPSAGGNVPSGPNCNGTFNTSATGLDELFQGQSPQYQSGMSHSVTGLSPSPYDPPALFLQSGDSAAIFCAYANSTTMQSGAYVSLPIEALSYAGRPQSSGDRQELYNALAWAAQSSAEHVPPMITVQSPSAGQVVRGGEKALVRWSSFDQHMAPNCVNVSYSLYSGSPPWEQVGSSLPDNGTFVWDVPQIDSSSVRLRVTAYDNNSNTGEAETSGDFTIDSTGPFVSLSYPNAGERFGAQDVNILWAASDNFALPQDPIWITYSTDGGASWLAVAGPIPNNSPYKWSIPANASSSENCIVDVTVRDGVGYASSAKSGVFTIDLIKPTAAAVAEPSTVVSPGTLITLNGSGSSDNFKVLNYTWTLAENGTVVTLYGERVTRWLGQFGLVSATLNVSDGVNFATDSVEINVTDTREPVADAGPDAVIPPGAVYQFDGSATTDDVPQLLNYTWTFKDNGTVELYGVKPTYRFAREGDYTVTLLVRDYSAFSDSDSVQVKVVSSVSPQAAKVSPANGALGVALNATITINFTKEMNPATLTRDSFVSQPELPPWSAAWNDAGTGVRITFPKSQNSSITPLLAEHSSYSLELRSAITDLAGISLRQFSWSFTTADVTPPSIYCVPQLSAVEGDTVSIVAQVTDNVAISYVVMYAEAPGGASTAVPMEVVDVLPQGAVYRASVANLKPGTLKVHVEAADSSGNVARSPEAGDFKISVAAKFPAWMMYVIIAVVLVGVALVGNFFYQRRKTNYLRERKGAAKEDVEARYSDRVNRQAAHQPATTVDEDVSQAPVKKKQEKAPEAVPVPLPLPPPPPRVILEPELEETVKRWAKRKPGEVGSKDAGYDPNRKADDDGSRAPPELAPREHAPPPPPPPGPPPQLSEEERKKRLREQILSDESKRSRNAEY